MTARFFSEFLFDLDTYSLCFSLTRGEGLAPSDETLSLRPPTSRALSDVGDTTRGPAIAEPLQQPQSLPSGHTTGATAIRTTSRKTVVSSSSTSVGKGSC